MPNPTTIPATLHLPIPGVVMHPEYGASVAVGPISNGSVKLEGRRWARVVDCVVPLAGHPVNVLSLARAVWAATVGEAAPPLLLVEGRHDEWQIVASEQVGSTDGVPRITFCAHHPTRRTPAVPALEGITDPLEALAIIATAVLGGAA